MDRALLDSLERCDPALPLKYLADGKLTRAGRVKLEKLLLASQRSALRDEKQIGRY